MFKSGTYVLCAVALLAGCKTAYYGTMDKLGYEKRDILVSRVKDARNDQDAASKQFQTTLQRFEEVTNYKGGDLEAEYNKLKSEYESAQDRAADVNKRIAKVESVANDMFTEWKGELSQYSDPSLRATSQQELDTTEQRYKQLILVMKNSASKMDPVLKAFGDRVLFLKHNLNAAAITSLSGTSVQVQSDVQSLVNDMNKSIKEADNFIAGMQQKK
jgi:gas vesicle protein